MCTAPTHPTFFFSIIISEPSLTLLFFILSWFKGGCCHEVYDHAYMQSWGSWFRLKFRRPWIQILPHNPSTSSISGWFLPAHLRGRRPSRSWQLLANFMQSLLFKLLQFVSTHSAFFNAMLNLTMTCLLASESNSVLYPIYSVLFLLKLSRKFLSESFWPVKN